MELMGALGATQIADDEIVGAARCCRNDAYLPAKVFVAKMRPAIVGR